MSNYSCGGGRGGGAKLNCSVLRGGDSSKDFYGLPTFTNYVNMGAQVRGGVDLG